MRMSCISLTNEWHFNFASMKAGQCPKRSSLEIYSNLYLKKSERRMSGAIFKSFWGVFPRIVEDCYVCVSCGYTERYVSDRDSLDRVRSVGRHIQKG